MNEEKLCGYCSKTFVVPDKASQKAATGTTKARGEIRKARSEKTKEPAERSTKRKGITGIHQK
jgi:hypothetical protein